MNWAPVLGRSTALLTWKAADVMALVATAYFDNAPDLAVSIPHLMFLRRARYFKIRGYPTLH